MSSVFVYISSIGFLAGVALGSVGSISLWILVSSGILGCTACVASILVKKKAPLFLGLFLITSAFGFIRAEYSFAEKTSFLDTFGQVVIEGMVIDEPTFSEKSQKVLVEVRRGEEKENILLVASLFPEFVYGDVVRVSGVFKKPEAFMTDTGAMFDYPAYLAKDGVRYQVIYPKIEIVSQDGGNFLYSVLFTLRRTFISTLHAYLPEPHATLAGGISIGAQDGMSTEVSDMFRRVGLIHIVVLSGYNITVVADSVMRMTAFLPRIPMLSSGALVVVLFTIMAGASATAVRASVMALIAMLARMVGEKYDISRALALTATIMVLCNPRILLFDPSFQLSFLATFGLIHLSPIFERVFVTVTPFLGLRQILASTLATQAFVVPFLIWKTGQVSLISLVANILVLPTVPASMFLSGVLGVVGSFVPVLGVIFSFPTTLILSYVITTASTLSRVPFASVEVGVPPMIVLVVVYIVLLLIIWKYKKTRIEESVRVF